MHVLCLAIVPRVAYRVAPKKQYTACHWPTPTLTGEQFPVFVPKEIAPVDTKTATTQLPRRAVAVIGSSCREPHEP